jgi:hypothetical protein
MVCHGTMLILSNVLRCTSRMVQLIQLIVSVLGLGVLSIPMRAVLWRGSYARWRIF